MDLIKIGKYIAEKRKSFGLTQRQLAEQLGVSDKSVSKWERGICLPDVSLYFELCRILGIGINEFLHGEDILAENIVQKSEENIIGITTESKKEQKRLNSIIHRIHIILAIALIIIIIPAVYVAHHWFSTVNENNIASMAHQVSEYFNENELSVVRTETRGNYLVALCTYKNSKQCMCVFDRDSLFKSRWKASGGVPVLSEGNINSWHYCSPSGEAVLVFCGLEIPDEVRFYEFTNNRIEYRCPVNENGVVLDLFVIPGTQDINGTAIIPTIN